MSELPVKCYFGYNTYGITTSFTTGTAGTTTFYDQFQFPSKVQIYMIQSSISSATIPATAPGIALIRQATRNSNTAGSTTIALPQADILLTCVVVPTARGSVGQDKIIFGRDSEGPIINTTSQLEIFFHSQTAGIPLTIITTFYWLPIMG